SARRARIRAAAIELARPGSIGGAVVPVDLGAVGGGDRTQLLLARIGAAEDAWRAEGERAFDCRGGVVDHEPEAGQLRMLVPRLLVEDDACLTRAPETHGLAAVAPAEGEAELGEHLVEVGKVGAGDLDEVHAPGGLRRAQAGVAPAVFGGGAGGEPREGAAGVCGGARDIRLPEGCVEDLEREWSGVAGTDDVDQEGGECEVTLAGEQAVVA